MSRRPTLPRGASRTLGIIRDGRLTITRTWDQSYVLTWTRRFPSYKRAAAHALTFAALSATLSGEERKR